MLQTNTSLILRVRDPHDTTSWQEFVELYEPLLVSYARSRGLHETDARDVVQETFINLLRALPKFELDHRRGRFRTWLWQVTINAISDQMRRRRSQDRAVEGWRDRAEEKEDDSELEFAAAHRLRVLEFVLPKVRAKTQEKTWHCFEQSILRGRAGAEVAAEVGLPVNTVYVHSSRVLAKVRALCAEHMEDFDDEPNRLPQ
jgi:RNA polymerase sigma-70 factor (ECF subfamily)